MIRSSFLPSAQTLFFPASQAFFTASHTSAAYSVSVWEKVSGEYSYRKLVPCYTDLNLALHGIIMTHGHRVLLCQLTHQLRMIYS